MLIALVGASSISTGSQVKGFAVVFLGVFLGTVGLEIYSGSSRFTFGVTELMGGVSPRDGPGCPRAALTGQRTRPR